VVQGTRRFTISGFGGQGKTTLALEVGEWLYRTDLFQYVCFVPYAAFQGEDAVGLAVSTLATVLGQSLVDVEAANAALLNRATLLILDNIEAIKAEPLQALLTVAKAWADIGKCRVLLTTRPTQFQHADYPTEGDLSHQLLLLEGLAEDDALDYFQRLLKLPPAPKVELPKREAVLNIFRQVAFHPLSIGLLAQQLKVRRVADLGRHLEKVLAEVPDNPLLASLNLSLERLDEQVRGLLPRLGVFQGGALLSNLQAITAFSDAQLQALLPALLSVGLVQAEELGGNVMYLKFHPTLAPALWIRLGAEEQAQLQASHRQRYYDVSGYLYVEDQKNPYETRAIVQRELPNLLFAVHGALDAEEAYSVEFVERIYLFLNIFGLKRDSKVLSQRIEHFDDFLARSNKGKQLFSAGKYQEAAQVFSEVLKGLGNDPSFNHCTIFVSLGQCFYQQGQAAQAVECYRQGLAVAEQLEPSEDVKRKMAVLQAGLADALTDMGDYDGARKVYESALAIVKEINDHRSVGAINGQLGTLAMLQGNLQEAETLIIEAISTFQRLNEPEHEAINLHKLGSVYKEAEQWDAAEQAYRESAQIQEYQGNLAGAAKTWNQLAHVTQLTGKPEEAEAWYRKAIDGAKTAGDRLQVSIAIKNLASFLQTHYPNRLSKAQQLMEEALAIDETSEPTVTEIWKSYHVLAEIAEKQNDTAKASEYRRQSREAYLAFPGARHSLQQHERFINAVVAAVENLDVRKELAPVFEQMGTGNLVAAIQRIFDGERDIEVLCESLDYQGGAVIDAILRGL
jgi:tetratricopeptide (TPR) repeat protein